MMVSVKTTVFDSFAPLALSETHHPSAPVSITVSPTGLTGTTLVVNVTVKHSKTSAPTRPVGIQAGLSAGRRIQGRIGRMLGK